jgi:serine/threonine-protein kinase
VIAQRYQVEGILGEGGMGVVVMATHLVLQQRVAIKFLRREAMADADAVDRFVREARAAACVQSEHVVRVQDVAMLDDGTPYIVMEYVEGTVLSTLLASHGPMPIRDAARFAIQTCDALVETHAAGIVHGDLKPENIYIAGAPEGTRKVKLLDFGISKILREDRVSRESFVMGTPAYMSPEQFESGAVDVRSDLWSLGAVLYEMLSGTPPFPGDSPETIRDAVMKGTIPPIARAGVPPGLVDIVYRCLEKNPKKRHASAAELAAELELYAPVESSSLRLERTSTRLRTAAMSTSQRLVPTVVLPSRRRSYGTWALAFAGLAGIISLVVGLLYASGHIGRRKPVAAAAATVPEPPATVSAAPIASVALDAPAPAAASPSASLSSAAAKSSAPRARPTPTTRRPAVGPVPAPSPSAEADRFGTRK